MCCRIYTILIVVFLLVPKIVFCQEQKVTIKADRIYGDQIDNQVIAKGNVEVNKQNQTLISDKIIYNKNSGWISSDTETFIIDKDVGNLFSNQVRLKDDFSNGQFVNPILIFNDGKFISAKDATQSSANKISFLKPSFSICANEDITKNNNLARNSGNLITLESANTIIDKSKKRIVSKHVVVNIMDIPVLYTPYLSIPTQQNKRSSGFLTPSYINNSRIGFGIQTPYFANISDSVNLIITPKIYPSNNQATVNTSLEQILKYGKYKAELEISNNEISSSSNLATQNRTDADYRYLIKSSGNLIYNKNSYVNFDILTTGDKDYLRDFNFKFIPYTESKINYEYTKNRNYFKAETIRFQELEQLQTRDQAQWVLPSISHHIQSKPKFFNETYHLTSNITSITRESGIQYNRITTIPKVEVPINFKGNLFNIKLSNQFDYYLIEENLDGNRDPQNNFKKEQSNSKGNFSAEWKLPLIQEKDGNIIVLEPKVQFISSGNNKNPIAIPNEDSNNSELTINNLFIEDRIAGYDRVEVGERVNYGVTSTIYQDKQRFELDIGQSHLINSRDTDDVIVRGFSGDSNKSNIVGKSSYQYDNIFNINYNFQLDESNLNNKINYISASLNYKNFGLSNEYLLIRRGAISNQKISQNTTNASYKITPKVLLSGSLTRDLRTKQDLMRVIAIENIDCCILTKFSIMETNTPNLIKKERSFNINITIKDL